MKQLVIIRLLKGILSRLNKFQDIQLHSWLCCNYFDNRIKRVAGKIIPHVKSVFILSKNTYHKYLDQKITGLQGSGC